MNGKRSSSRHMAMVIAFANVLALTASHSHAQSQQPQPIVPYIQQHLGLDEDQVRSALGILLVFARERLPKPQFDQLARRMPNAEMLMGQTRAGGVVTGPLDDEGEYEVALTRLGIAPQSAGQFAPLVQQYLGLAGYYEERDALSRVFD
jgi:Protein of unknown function VcgC/VcgE (DUF2780)